MRTDDFDYDLPPDLIAQSPVPRGASRLLVLHRNDGRIEHKTFPALRDYLHAGDTLVLNDTRVSSRRLKGVREAGHPAEVFLIRPIGDRQWEALVRPGRALGTGKTVRILSDTACSASVLAQIVGTTEGGGRILEFPDAATRDALAHWGETPLPPYIQQTLPQDQEERYQTVYSRFEGSAAAPTAGLHFTTEILDEIRAAGVSIANVTLHVGIDTFRPVRTDVIEDHVMHGESFVLSPESAQTINQTTGKIIAVGTTSVRVLETVAAWVQDDDGNSTNHTGKMRVEPANGETHLFISPGFRFRATEGMLTNFHLPRSTLLMLVSAFAGREHVLNAYNAAVRDRYRFFSFGDAMLII